MAIFIVIRKQSANHSDKNRCAIYNVSYDKIDATYIK